MSHHRDLFVEQSQDLLQVADNGLCDAHVFVDLGVVDVDLQDLCVFAESLCIADLPVGKAGAEGDDKICL